MVGGGFVRFCGRGFMVGTAVDRRCVRGGFVFSAFPLNGLVRGQLSSLVDFFMRCSLSLLERCSGFRNWSIGCRLGFIRWW